jgi:thiol-disulfide isomerase/thioredoxin
MKIQVSPGIKKSPAMILVISFVLTCCYGCNGSISNNEKVVVKAVPGTKLSIQKSVKDTLEFDTFIELNNHFSKKYSEHETRSSNPKNQKSMTETESNQFRDSVREAGYAIIRERSNSILKYIQTHGKNEESLNGMVYLAYDFNISLKKFDSVFQLFPLKLQNSSSGKALANIKKEKKVLDVGSHYNLQIRNLVFWDTAGNKKMLSSINTRYILLDFWASWCPPCRHQNRWLEDHMESIERPDLSIVAISMDQNKAKWVKASREDKMHLLNICDFKDLESPIAKEFKLNGVPHNVLLTKEGEILAYDLWKEDLVDVIKSLP